MASEGRQQDALLDVSLLDAESGTGSTPGDEERRQCVLFVGHGGSPTGFARVLHSVIRYLPARWQPHLLGINYHGSPTREAGYLLHPNPRPDEPHAESELPRLLERLQPALVVVLDEPWVAAEHACLRAPGRRFRSTVYAAIDSPGSMSPDLAAQLSGFDSFVAFTEYGRRVVGVAVRKAQRARPDLQFPPVAVIPHGVDTTLFRPLVEPSKDGDFSASRRLARRQLFEECSELRQAFVVLNANRNQPFKRLDVTIEGFALFARDKPPNVRLFLHTATREPTAGEKTLVDRWGVRNRLLYLVRGEDHPRLPSERLNLVYNACDVGINTSEKEGWGLIAFEHAATGAAQVVPRHSAPKELWRDAGCFLEPARRTDPERIQFARRTVTPEGVAAELERLYRDRDHLRARSLAAYRLANRPEYQWQSIARAWDSHFELLANPGGRAGSSSG